MKCYEFLKNKMEKINSEDQTEDDIKNAQQII